MLWELHWLRVPEHIQFRLCVLAYHCVHSTAPAYLADSLQLTADAPARRRLRSTDTMMLPVPSMQRATIGDRAFLVAWNSLLPATRDAISCCSFASRFWTDMTCTDSLALISLVLATYLCTVPLQHHLMWQCHFNLFLINNNNNNHYHHVNISKQAYGVCFCTSSTALHTNCKQKLN